MRLIINQVRAQIGIERTPGKLEMQSEIARLEIHQKHAKINIQSELPKVEIDQHEAFASAGLKGPLELTIEAADRGRQQVLEYIGKTAADGYALAAIERGGNPIADIAVRDAYPVHEFGYDYMPKVGPRFNVTGSVKIEAEPNGEGVHNGVEFNVIPGSLRYNYTPTRINIYMQRYPSISFSYQGNSVDKYV